MPAMHATCVAVDGRGILICGPSGSGKSDLALRLIDRGAMLVADDQTVVENRDGTLWASTPVELSGKLEVRGVGIMELPAGPATVSLVVELVPPDAVERLPETESLEIEGLDLPLLRLAPFEASADAKVRMRIARRAG